MIWEEIYSICKKIPVNKKKSYRRQCEAAVVNTGLNVGGNDSVLN